MRLLTKLAKCTTLFLLMLLSSTLLLALTPNAAAQDEEPATVIVTTTTGGTTNPVPGTYTYNSGDRITLRATPDEGYTFLQWIISGGYTPGHNQPPLIQPNPEEPLPPSRPPTPQTYDSLVATQNPLFVVCGFGYTFQYEAVFVSTTPAEKAEAVVVVKSAAGGSTNPGIGTYTFVDGSEITLTATPNTGYDFQYWIATGTGTAGHEGTLILDNPLNILCGVGYTYEYQPVFTPEGAVTTTEGIPAEYFYAAVIILVILVIAGFGVALMYRGKRK